MPTHQLLVGFFPSWKKKQRIPPVHSPDFYCRRWTVIKMRQMLEVDRWPSWYACNTNAASERRAVSSGPFHGPLIPGFMGPGPTFNDQIIHNSRRNPSCSLHGLSRWWMANVSNTLVGPHSKIVLPHWGYKGLLSCFLSWAIEIILAQRARNLHYKKKIWVWNNVVCVPVLVGGNSGLLGCQQLPEWRLGPSS